MAFPRIFEVFGEFKHAGFLGPLLAGSDIGVIG